MTDLAKWLFEQLEADRTDDDAGRTRYHSLGQIIQLAAQACILERRTDKLDWGYWIDTDGNPRPRDTDDEPYVGALILRHLALLLYTDREGYRPEWDPEWRPDDD